MEFSDFYLSEKISCSSSVFTQRDFFLQRNLQMSVCVWALQLLHHEFIFNWALSCQRSLFILPSTLHISETREVWHTWININRKLYQLVWNLAVPSTWSGNFFFFLFTNQAYEALHSEKSGLCGQCLNNGLIIQGKLVFFPQHRYKVTLPSVFSHNGSNLLQARCLT